MKRARKDYEVNDFGIVQAYDQYYNRNHVSISLLLVNPYCYIHAMRANL